MRKPKKQRERKTVVLTVRITPSAYAHLQEQSASAGISVSALARTTLAGVQVRTRADAELLGELRRQGGLCKLMYNAGADPAATGAALAALEEAAASIIRSEI